MPVLDPDALVIADIEDLQSQLDLKELLSNKATDFSVLNNTKFPTTQAVSTEITTKVVGLYDDRGNHDASGNVFPSTGGSGTAGAILKGDIWYVPVAGTMGAVTYIAGNTVRALVDAPGQTAGNWAKGGVGYVPENVANKTTEITSTASDTKYVTEGAGYRNFHPSKWGIPKHGYKFDGVTGHYLTGGDILASLAEYDFTVSFLAYLEDCTTGVGYTDFAKTHPTTTYHGYRLYRYNNNKFILEINGVTSGAVTITTTADVALGWHWITVVKSTMVNSGWKLYIDGVSVAVTASATTTVVGTTVTTRDFRIGASSHDTGSFAKKGIIADFRIDNFAMTAAEVLQACGNGLGSGIDWKYQGGGVSQTSGTFTVGKAYITRAFAPGDDISNVASTGAAANVTGAEWIATGTAPTTYTNGSTIVSKGTIFLADMEHAGDVTCRDLTVNQNHLTVVGATPLNREDLVPVFLAMTDDSSFVVPYGYELESLYMIASTGSTTIRGGTAADGAEVFAGTAVTTAQIQPTLLLTYFSNTANQTVYISDTGGGWTGTVSLKALLRRVV